MTVRRPDVAELEAGIRAGDRTMLARGITLVESRRADHRVQARALVERLLQPPTDAHRVGISGVPGVGKSTFIEALGKRLTGAGRRVAVLAVDPSSTRSGGSILGDKTRMAELARDPAAFVRPSPTAGSLGGVARHTREAMLLCEAAGYDVIIVETVGVGQSEVMVSEMVDFFLVLMLAGAGDELQGIKRGILEIADMLAVNKADGDNAPRARRARADYQRALALMQPKSAHWKVPVHTCSALEGQGLDELWADIEAHRKALTDSGEWAQHRAAQRVRWMWRALEAGLMDRLRDDARVSAALPVVESRLRAGTVSPDHAAADLMDAFLSGDV